MHDVLPCRNGELCATLELLLELRATHLVITNS